MASEFDKKLTAYQLAYSMQPFRNVSIYPKILEKKTKFSAEEKAHLTRKGFRWYVYYDYINPATGEFTRQKTISGKVNRLFPDFDDRLEAIKNLQSTVKELLKEGYSPYRDREPDDHTITDSLTFGLAIKKEKVSSPRTYEGYEKSVNALIEHLKKTGRANRSIKDLNQPMIVQFLDGLSVSNRTRNNYRSDLSAVLSVLVAHGYLENNPAMKIEREPNRPKRDPTFSVHQVRDVFQYWEKDRAMLMYLYFVMYMFWRPRENCRIRIKDINLEEKIITIPETKTSGMKVKRIPDLILDELREYIKDAQPEDLLFTPTGPGLWHSRLGGSTKLDNRRDYFTKKWNDHREAMGLDPEYTIYGLRHTGATILYKRLIQKHTKDQALQTLSQITGHTSKAILEYIHYIDASLPEDYSELFK